MFQSSSSSVSPELFSFVSQQKAPAVQDPTILDCHMLSQSTQDTSENQLMQAVIDPTLVYASAPGTEFTASEWSSLFDPMYQSASQQAYFPAQTGVCPMPSDAYANTVQMTTEPAPYDTDSTLADLTAWPWLDQSDPIYEPALQQEYPPSSADQCTNGSLQESSEVKELKAMFFDFAKEMRLRIALLEENTMDSQRRFDEETTRYCSEVSDATAKLQTWTDRIREAAEMAEASCRPR